MSCIAEILKEKGDQEYLLSKCNFMAVEDGGEYKGYEYLITFVALPAHRCGYVALKNDTQLDIHDFDVHGGITFQGKTRIEEFLYKKTTCDDIWIGFDAGHSCDENDLESLKKIWPEKNKEFELALELNEMQRTGFPRVIRSKKYMINQCKKLIDQIEEIDNGVKK